VTPVYSLHFCTALLSRFNELNDDDDDDIGGVDISPVDHILDLGVTLDLLLTMKQHTNTIAHSCFYQMRQLRSV